MLRKGGACWVQAKEFMAMMFCGKIIVFFGAKILIVKNRKFIAN
jgi:hypothetical protein